MATTNDAIRAWMREVLDKCTRDGRPLTARKWALDAGLNAATVQRALRDDYSFTPSTRTLHALASVVDIPLPAMTASGAGQALAEVRWANAPTIELSVRHRVSAGTWSEVDDQAQVEMRRLNVQRVPPYEQATQWLELVVGDSYNRLVPEGSYVHVVDAVEINYTPRTGDTVVLARRRAQGALEERSLKQVELTAAGPLLWPRSFNPRWSQPIDLTEGVREGEDVEVQIVGLVVRSYQLFV